jgi:hypothetical protein
MKGREFMQTKEYKDKVRKIAKEKGYGKWMAGKKMLPQVRKALITALVGMNHWNFNGRDSRYWRKQALFRDDFTCQVCGLKDPEIMEVDHLKSKSLYPELKYDLDNLVSICPNCHRRKSLRDVKNKAVRLKPRKITLLEA